MTALGSAGATRTGPGVAAAASLGDVAPAEACRAVAFRQMTVQAGELWPFGSAGRCADAAGRCALRAAIEEADAAPAGASVVISVPAGSYGLTLGTLTAGSASAPLSITIDGAWPGRTVISAGNAFRVMSVSTTATAVPGRLRITAGNAGHDGYGGGVFSSGRLTLAGVVVNANRAGAGGGWTTPAGRW